VGESPGGWPVSTWPDGALAQAPVRLGTPATLPAGDYLLVAGFVDPASNTRSPAVPLGSLPIQRRPVSFVTPTAPQPLATPVQFGTHARLLGYDTVQEGETLPLRLYWEVLQTLLPPHNIFVHLDEAGGLTVAQADGPPRAADQRAPTGSWLPGEYLVTVHQLLLPKEMTTATLRVGLYQPETGLRLPTSIGGQPTGDAAELPWRTQTK
ncbi:MAG TPA: hypothetical protein PKE45_11475, partial [Caldilineaceae bacterium]|nr:hypothetical protein [Caldilineaceae bacterium]